MSMKLTEREEELIKWILILIDVANRYSIFFGLIKRDTKWLEGIWSDDDIKNKQDELLDVLRDKYDVPLKVTTNVKALLEKK